MGLGQPARGHALGARGTATTPPMLTPCISTDATRGVSRLPTGRYPRKWEWVADQLAARIHSGEWVYGQRLPPQSALCDQYGVCEKTARRALRHLADQDVISPLLQGRPSTVRAGSKRGARRAVTPGPSGTAS